MIDNHMRPPRREEGGDKKIYRVFCLDDHAAFYYLTRTAYEAMESHLYCLNLRHYDKNAKIQLLGGGRTLSIVHNGTTWACPNNQ